ncbi:rhodanese-like domain-containing protein [Thioalkalicoccus limnaeus]|uniref:Rhodanese-like domain-containing protein n=1 Tax=Thioalkalicoccus limnaeus TaxID=120681 RepID=A0ABV4BI81_9GAMM
MKRAVATTAGLLGLVSLVVVVSTGCQWDSSASLSEHDISAPDSWALASQGEMTIIDIRTPREWRQTGVVAGVREIDMQHPGGLEGFVRELLAEVDGDKDAPIGLICRTGNRSGQVQQVLTAVGFTNVYNIAEGMAGSRAGPGWLRRGLPVESCTRC